MKILGVQLPIEEISHIESLQKKTWFYANDQGYQSIYTLKDLSYQLPNSFLRIHRSYIVNISYIMKFHEISLQPFKSH